MERCISASIGQLFIITVETEEMNEDLRRMIVEEQVGGVILFQRNLRDLNKVVQLIEDMQHTAYVHQLPPLWIAIDQEGGGISYLFNDMVVSPGNMLIGATRNPQHAYQAGFDVGVQLRAIGFNLNFAPVLDINHHPDNPVIGTRSFGADKRLVSVMGVRMMQGYHDAGILAVGKHYPGHGDTHQDSHLSLPVIEQSLADLKERELYPFRQCIAAGMEALMTAHILFPQVDSERPATLSSYFLQTLLRKQEQFDGLIITDSLEMEAIATYYGRERGAIEAFKAGADIVLACGRSYAAQSKMIEAVRQAVLNQELETDRMEACVDRVLRFKRKWLGQNTFRPRAPFGDIQEIRRICRQPTIQERMKEIALQGITLVQDRCKLLPPAFPPAQPLLVISQRTLNDEIYMADRINPVQHVFHSADYEHLLIDGGHPQPEDIERISASLSKNRTVLLFINERRHPDTSWLQLVDVIRSFTERIILISIWNPQMIRSFHPTIGTSIVTYSNTFQTLEALRGIMEGKYPFRGTTPVTLSQS